MRELHEAPNAVPDIRSPRDLSADIFSNQINDYTARSDNNTKPVNDSNEADIINNALNPSSLYGDQANRQIAAPDRDLDLSQTTTAGHTKTSVNGPPTVEDALHWAKRNMHRFDGNRDGGISRTELNLAEFGNRLNDHDKQMARILLDNYDTLKRGNIDRSFPFDGDRERFDAISGKDIDKHLGRIELKRRLAENAEESRDIAQTMMSGEPPLFEFLDRAKNGKVDGKISKGDLEEYMKDARYFQGATSGPYAAENVQAVQRLLNTWNTQSYPSPGLSLRGINSPMDMIRGDHKYITYGSLARAAGIA